MQIKASVIGPVALAVGILVGGALGYRLATRPTTVVVPSPAAAPSGPVREAPSPVAMGPSASSSAERRGGVIAGKVVTPDGKPVAGVLVRATPLLEELTVTEPGTKPPPGRSPPRETFEREVREFQELMRRFEGGKREATTDASGAFSLDGLPYKRYDVDAVLVGYRIERVTGNEWEPVTVGRPCDFRAVPCRALRFSVTLPDGSAPEIALIQCKSMGGADSSGSDMNSLGWSPTNRELILEYGTYEVRAVAPAFARSPAAPWRMRHRDWRQDDGAGAAYKSEPRTVTVGDDEPAPISLTLVGQPGIVFRLVYSSWEHPRSARIAALRLEPGRSMDPNLLLGLHRVTAMWLDDETEGTIAGLTPGTYLVGVTFRGGFVGPTATVTVGSGLVTQELRVQGELRDWVKVRVRGPDGEPVPDAQLESGCRGPSGSGMADLGLEPEADGSFKVEHYEMDAPEGGSGSSSIGKELGLAPRTYFVKVVSQQYGEMEVAYDPAGNREVTVTYQAAAVLRATVTGWAESPDQKHTSLSLEPKKRGIGGSPQSFDAEIDADGAATFPPVKPGKYDLVLRVVREDPNPPRRTRTWHSNEVSRLPLNLTSGECAVTVAIPALHELTVTFEGDAPTLQRIDPDGVPQHVDRDGGGEGGRTATFSDLAPGRYRLCGRNGDMWVDVPSASAVTFRPSPFNAYFLQVLDHGYLLELGLKTGDLVVAIDGAEFKDLASLDAAMQSAKKRASVAFTIQREGRRFDVSTDGRRFEEDEGSLYEPWAR